MNNNNNNKPLQLHIDYGWCGVFLSWRYSKCSFEDNKKNSFVVHWEIFLKRYYSSLTIRRKNKGEFADTFILTDSITAVFVSGDLYRVHISKWKEGKYCFVVPHISTYSESMVILVHFISFRIGYWKLRDFYDLADLRIDVQSPSKRISSIWSRLSNLRTITNEFYLPSINLMSLVNWK